MNYPPNIEGFIVLDRNTNRSVNMMSSLLNLGLNAETKTKIKLDLLRLKTEEKQMSHIMSLARKKEVVFKDDVEGIKSLKDSTALRKKGNDAVNEKNFESALLWYTKAVATAPYPEKNSSSDDSDTTLSLALANRSLILLTLKKYRLCLKDIKYALEMNYPRDLKYKLYERQLKCLLALKEVTDAHSVLKLALESLEWTEKISDEKKQSLKVEFQSLFSNPDVLKGDIGESVSKPLPNLDLCYGPHSFLPGCSNSVEVKATTDMGLGLFATREIEIGDLLVCEEPFSWTLVGDNVYEHCTHCCRECRTLIPCFSCSLVMFCSEKCRKESWEQYHGIECKVFRVLKHAKFASIGSYVLRIVIMARKRYKSLSSFYKTVKVFDKYSRDNFAQLRDECGNDVNLNYFFIYHVQQEPHFFIGEALCCLLESYYLCHLLEKKSDFFSCGEESETMSRDQLVNFISCLILRHLKQPGHLNHYWKMLDNSPYKFQVTLIGELMYSTVNLINHSCDPNVFFYFAYGKKIVVSALKKIKAGEQIFYVYIPGANYWTSPLNKRHTLLNDCRFTCRCVACTENWPTQKELEKILLRIKCQGCHNELFGQYFEGIQVCDTCRHANNVIQLRDEVCKSLSQFHRNRTGTPLTALRGEIINMLKLLESHVCRPCDEMLEFEKYLRDSCSLYPWYGEC